MSLFRKINEQNMRKLQSKKQINRPKRKVVKSNFVNDVEKNRRSVETFKEDNLLPELEIVSVSYSVMSRDTIDRISVCEVTKINKTNDKTNTPNDQRFGTIDNNSLCATCEKTNENCPGHLGIIKLPSDVIHPFFRMQTMRTLQCVCNTCSSLLMEEKIITETGLMNMSGFNRLGAIAERCKDGKVKCSLGCPANPIFKSTKSVPKDITDIDMYCINKIGKQEIPSHIPVSKIKKILSNISKRDAELMGFQNNHPKNFIVDFVPVIPISARPYDLREGQIKEDHLTMTYTDIVSKKMEILQQSNEKLDIAQEESKKEECLRRIIYWMERSIQNCGHEYKRSPADPCKAINDRLSGKESLIRGHMLAKRTDHAGRTVLGPNRSIAFGEVAAPMVMMKNLTVEEKITNYNFEYFQELSSEGKIDYLCPQRGSFSGRKLKYDKDKHVMNIGDIVGRHSENGDPVLFNRQPTLHKNCMLGYRIKFQPKLTIGVHLSSTGGHNADFDGDEGNIHMIQTVESQTEARLLMYARNNINMAKNSGPIVGMSFNSITGAYLLTRDDLVFTKKEFMEGINYVMNFTNDTYVADNIRTLDSRRKMNTKDNKFSGRILASILFPEDFVYTHIDKGTVVKIRKGILISGQLSKVHVGDSPGTIIQSLYKQYGQKITSEFITNATFLFNWYSEKYGLSISVRDSIPRRIKEFQAIKREMFDKLNDEVITYPNIDDNDTSPEMLNIEKSIIKKIRDESLKVQKLFFDEYLEKNNSLDIMVKSKAKGKEQQISYISAFLGQQFYGGANRATKKATGGKRWLTTFHVDDNSIYSRGFVVNSFYEGMNADEYFASSQAARTTLAGQKLSTSKTGTTQRSMTKAQENLIVKYDGTVRDHNNIIFQFNYGVGIAPTEMVNSPNNLSMRTRSFINLRELIEKENTEQGFPDFDISSKIVSYLNDVNKKYGDDKIILEEDELIEGDLGDFQEMLTFQDTDEYMDFEASFEEE